MFVSWMCMYSMSLILFPYHSKWTMDFCNELFFVSLCVRVCIQCPYYFHTILRGPWIYAMKFCCMVVCVYMYVFNVLIVSVPFYMGHEVWEDRSLVLSIQTMNTCLSLCLNCLRVQLICGAELKTHRWEQYDGTQKRSQIMKSDDLTSTKIQSNLFHTYV